MFRQTGIWFKAILRWVNRAMEHRQEISYQLDLFVEQRQHDIRSSDNRKGVPQAKARKAAQIIEDGRQIEQNEYYKELLENKIIKVPIVFKGKKPYVQLL